MISRMRILLAVMLTALVIFTGRLTYLQLARAETYAALSERNFTEERRIAPLRGRILAGDGTVLADNRVAYDLMYWGGAIRRWERLRHLLALPETPRPPDASRPEERRNGAVLAWNIPDALIPAVEELVAGQVNLYLRQRIERTYPTNLAAHVVGYTSLADPERQPGYVGDDLTGVMGIEAGFENVLFGTPGAELVEVDNRGVLLRSTVLDPARPGQDVMLTIDPQVQRLAEDVLGQALQYVNEDRARTGEPLEELVRGTLIAIDLENHPGAILAMASAPSFEQNVFVKRPTDPEAVSAILQDTVNFPLTNRAVEAYPPASTFKLVTSSALLETGFIGPNSLFRCSAGYTLSGITWKNWAGYDKGLYDVRDAIADSCNTFFWQAVGSTPNATRGWGPFIEALVERARTFGYGSPIGVGVAEEKAGRIPDEAWVEAYYGHGWLPGYTLNTVIGQGDVLATPVQVGQLIATLALDGRQVRPHLVSQVGDEVIPSESRQLPGRYWDTLQEGMRMLFTDYPSSQLMGPGVFAVDVAGKTGTAQNPRGENYTHAWFMGYGPIQDPELAVVVFIEYGGSSSRVSVPVARDFMAAYWGIEIQ